MVAASDRDGVMFSLSAGNCGDGPEGRALLQKLGLTDHPLYFLMDRAYEGEETRALAWNLVIYQSFLPKAIAKILGTMIHSCTNSEIRSSAFFAASSAFAVFSLAMINLTLSFLPLSIWLLLLMYLCEHYLIHCFR